MEKLKQILQLLDAGMSQNKICAEARCSKRRVSACKRLADTAGKTYGELLALSDGELRTLFLHDGPGVTNVDDKRKVELDSMMQEVVRRLSFKHSTIQYVYEAYYRKNSQEPYGYTQFKKYIRDYQKANNLAYHNVHEPGREWQIDFAGDPLYLTDRNTGKAAALPVLVCVMPFSNLPWMMALPKATTDWFYHGLNKGLEFMGAMPHVAHSDNMKQWVNKSDRNCPAFADANQEWCSYYGIEATACRVRRPRDKGPVEGAVNQLYQYVYARLESEKFYELTDLNTRIVELLDEYCSRPFKGSTRWELFEDYEKPNMLPLPDNMFRLRLRKTVKLSNTYHVCVGSERHFYSVPFKYVGRQVKVLWDTEYVEVFVGSERVCMHYRSHVPYGYTTEKSHMPPNHVAYEQMKGQNASTLIERGMRIGPSVAWVIERMLERTNFPQQAYGTCNALLSLGKTYGYNRLSRACSIIRDKNGATTYRAVANMLKNNRDIDSKPSEIISKPPFNENVRGAKAYTSTNLIPDSNE